MNVPPQRGVTAKRERIENVASAQTYRITPKGMSCQITIIVSVSFSCAASLSFASRIAAPAGLNPVHKPMHHESLPVVKMYLEESLCQLVLSVQPIAEGLSVQPINTRNRVCANSRKKQSVKRIFLQNSCFCLLRIQESSAIKGARNKRTKENRNERHNPPRFA